MAKKYIFNMILNTINDVQTRNQADSKVETADPTVFDLIKNKLQNLDEKNKANRTQRGKSPVSILDRIRKESPILSELEKEGTIEIVGAMYDVATGKVEFY